MPGKRFDERANFIAHTPIVNERLFVGGGGAGKARRIVEAVVNPSRSTRKDRARFRRVVADGDDKIESNILNRSNVR